MNTLEGRLGRCAERHRSARFDRVAAIHDEVDDYPLELGPVDKDRYRAWPEQEVKPDPVWQELPQDGAEPLEDIVQVGSRWQQFLFARKRHQLAREFSGHFSCVADLAEEPGGLLVCGSRLAELGIQAYHGEKIVEVVCDLGGDPSDRLQPLRREKTIFLTTYCRDIAEIDRQAVRNRVNPNLENAAERFVILLKADRYLFPQCPPILIVGPSPNPRGKLGPHVLRNQTAARTLEDRLRLGVQIGESPLLVKREEGIAHRLERLKRPPLGFGEVNSVLECFRTVVGRIVPVVSGLQPVVGRIVAVVGCLSIAAFGASITKLGCPVAIRGRIVAIARSLVPDDVLVSHRAFRRLTERTPQRLVRLPARQSFLNHRASSTSLP